MAGRESVAPHRVAPLTAPEHFTTHIKATAREVLRTCAGGGFYSCGKISTEHGGDAFEGVDKSIGFFNGVVESERSPYRAFDSERLHKGLGAVVAGAHLHSELVEKHAGVVVVMVAEEERNDSAFAGMRTPSMPTP